jgi:hypothetical protein
LLALPVAALHALVLALPEGLVAQLLLLPGHAVEILHGPVHLPGHGVAHPAVGLGGLEVLQDVAQLLQEALRLRGVPALHHLLDLLQHAVEIVGGDGLAGLLLVLRLLPVLLLVALHPLGELAQELVHRLAQLLGELPHLVRVGVALQGLPQPLLGGAQVPLGVGEPAVLHLEAMAQRSSATSTRAGSARAVRSRSAAARRPRNTPHSGV